MWLIRLFKKWFKYLKKNIEYLILLVSLSLVVWLTLHYFKKEQTTQIISVLGISFALFQFLFNQVAIKKRQNYNLRYEAYKEVIQLVDAIAETLNEKMSNKGGIEVYGLVAKLTNQVNKLASTLNEYNYYLFPKINLTKESKQIEDIIQKILHRTDEFRYNVEHKIRIKHPEGELFLESLEAMNWHNDIRKHLKELHQNKYKFYHRLRQYFD